MKSKTALVIGGTGGIGSEIVRSLANEGVTVCYTYHTPPEDSLFGDLSGSKIFAYPLDLSDEESVNRSVAHVLLDNPALDIVVFAASVPITNKQVLKMTWDDVRLHLNTQVKGFFFLVQALRPLIKTSHKIKFIVVLTEYCIGKPPSGVSHYVTAKYALMGFAKSLAVELAKYNSTVNMVSPGMVSTGFIAALPPKLVEITAETNPLKRIATPRDVSDVVLFLCSDGSDYLNGVNIPINGGGLMQ